MPDITIDANATGDMRSVAQPENMVCINETRIYDFYLADANILAYRETPDGGDTWGAETIVYDGTVGAIAVKKFVVKFDEGTKGDTGLLIHIAYLARGGATSVKEYRELNTVDNTLAPAVDLGIPGGVAAVTGWVGANRSALTMTKSRTGRLHILGWLDNGALDRFHVVSTDGIIWTAVAPITDEGFNAGKMIAMPGNEASLDDIWCILLTPGLDIKVKVFDFSLNTWSAGTVVATVTTNNDTYFNFCAVEYFATDAVFIAAWNDHDIATADLIVVEVHTATTFTVRAQARTNRDGNFQAAMQVDQATGNLRIGFFDGAPEIAVQVFHALSTDGAVSWSAPILYGSTNDDHRWLGVAPMQGRAGGRFIMAYRNDDLDDILTNTDNAVDLGPMPETTTPAPRAPILGSFSRALSGGAGGFLSYITPDGRVYPLHTPHDFGRWVISFSGFGTPPIDYITQRGPFQHGATVRDFFLRPRVIQLLIRQGFLNRTAWWAGRASLLNEIRPNRQTTATAVLPGELRLVQTDRTTRSLNVFITEGPRFEPRVSTQWDEHALMEVLRFTAYDPVAFDPAQVTAVVGITLSAQLVFPITFPIQFGSGLVDDTLSITYVGTWLELPIITVVGPIRDLGIDNNATGEKIEFTADIGPGRTVTIDLREGFKTIVDDLGTNLIGTITSDSDLATFHLAPDPEAAGGVNVIRVRGTDPTGATSVTLAYFDRYFGF